MSNYVGARCPVCGKKFASGDDVVVCPICGAPHHRECYAQQGDCAFAADHMSGREWQPPQTEAEEAGEAAVRNCPKCGSANPEESIFCQVCGAHMNARSSDLGDSPMQNMFVFGQVDPFGGVDKNETIEGVSVADIARYVGPNSAYYIPRFYAISKHGAKVLLNLSALFFNFYYFFYRRMYAAGAAMFGAFLLSNVPRILLVWRTAGNAANAELMADQYQGWIWIGYVIYLLVSAAISLFATRIYMNKVLAGVRRQKEEEGPEIAERTGIFAQAGGVDKISVLLLVSFIFICNAFLIQMGYIAI